ncbi:MAG: hypothetical protein HXY38_00565, partial [Chloroflexi bacterium]|nr:hypothetical protein [Chloroflexota bacterium]
MTDGATAGDIPIGTYKRTTNGGSMGMSSNFVHCETSEYIDNTVYSAVAIHPFDAPGVVYPAAASGAGANVCIANNVVNDWRYIAGTSGYPNQVIRQRQRGLAHHRLFHRRAYLHLQQSELYDGYADEYGDGNTDENSHTLADSHNNSHIYSHNSA